jgi:hypothetical protein
MLLDFAGGHKLAYCDEDYHNAEETFMEQDATLSND